MRKIACYTLVLMLSLVAIAESWADAAESLQNGLEAYRTADFDMAVRELQKAIQQGLDDRSDLIQAHLHLGFAHIGRAERAAAEIEFSKAIQLDPSLELDPKLHSTKILNVFNDMRSNLVNSLAVVSVPGGAEVYLDGAKVSSGVTPLKLDSILVGEHEVRIVKNYFKPREIKVTVEKGEDNRVQVQLEKAEVEVRITSSPPEAALYIAEKGRFQNEPYGRTPVSLKAVLGQELGIRLAKEEFLNKELKMRLTEAGVAMLDKEEAFPLENGVSEVHVKLAAAPPPGRLRITSNPSGAEVRMDGVKLGNTPLNVDRITPGNRRLRFSMSGFTSVNKVVEMVSGQETEVSVELGGRLHVLSIPVGAQVFLDGQYAGITPLKTRNIPEGTHQLRLSVEKYRDRLTTARVEREQEREVNIRLIPLKGSIAISSKPTGAVVYLDGDSRGETPIFIYGVMVGKHSIKLTKPGYEDWEGQIDVEELKVTWQFKKLKSN